MPLAPYEKESDLDVYFNHGTTDYQEIPIISLEFTGTKWKTVSANGHRWNPSGVYIFVIRKGQIRVARNKEIPWAGRLVSHIDLARGMPIQFGGMILFGSSKAGRGIIRRWNDGTGHYGDADRPMDPGGVTLPIELFRPYSEPLKVKGRRR